MMPLKIPTDYNMRCTENKIGISHCFHYRESSFVNEPYVCCWCGHAYFEVAAPPQHGNLAYGLPIDNIGNT